MTIRVMCPACKAAYNLKADAEGKKVRCTNCQQTFVADSMPPSAEEEPEEEVAVAQRAPVKRKGPRGQDDLDVSDDAPRPKRGRAEKNTGRQVLVVGLILLAVLGFFAGLGTVVFFMFSEVEQKVSDADKGVLVTADQVAAKLPGLKVQPGLDKFRKVRKGFSNYETSYSYSSPDAAQGGLFLECTATVKSVESDAQITYIRATKDFNLGPAWEGKNKPQKVERNDLLRWGDESHCLVLRQEHAFVGNVFTARKGKRVFHLVVVGFAFLDGKSFQDLLTPVLQRLESYSP